MDDVTPAVLFKLATRRMTERTYIYDRGKSTTYENVNDSTAWEEYNARESTTHETNRWTPTSNGHWNDPQFPQQQARINKLHTINLQSDSGANRIVTDQLQLLQDVIFIKDYPMGGCNKDDIAITCTAKGKLTLHGLDGSSILVEAFYSSQVDGTIVSPTTVVRQHSTRFSSFLQDSNCDTNNGYITFVGRQGHTDFNLPLICSNDLWYHVQPSTSSHNKASINKMSAAATYELWHQRLAHAGTTVMSNLHQHATGVPKLNSNAFYRCAACMSGKLTTKRPYYQQKNKSTKKPPTQRTDDFDTEYIQGAPGQHFHIDFGFVRGYEDDVDQTSTKAKKKSLINTSIDGHNCYVIIIDRITRYTWVFLSKNKRPPVDIIRQVLENFKSETGNKTVRTDQGEELGHSTLFSNMIAECGFALEETRAGASSQNGMAERPNRTFGHMMRCMLSSAELGAEFWSYALIYAVYIKNRIYHSSIKCTPYEKMTGNKPDLSHLRIFGCRVFAKNPGKRPNKLDHHSSKGIFLGFTASTKNTHYLDESTGNIKQATNIIFDEACMTLPTKTTPFASMKLQQLGFQEETKNEKLKVQLITKSASCPVRATDGSIGYDLFADLDHDATIYPGQTAIIPTGIHIQTPAGTYARIAPRSGLTVKNDLNTLAGVIDPDYRGELKVVLHNFGDSIQTLDKHHKIAQLILEQAITSDVVIVDNLSKTSRGEKGFGSSDQQHILPSSQTTSTPTSAAAATLHSTLNTLTVQQVAFTPLEHIFMSTDPYDNLSDRTITSKKHDNNLLGMVLQHCTTRNLPRLMDCDKGSSSIRTPLWRSQLRGSYITHVNKIAIYSIDQIESIISTFRATKPIQDITITFATIQQSSMHPQYGVPTLYHDQMNIVGKHLWEISHRPEWNKTIDENIISPYVLDQDNQPKKKYQKMIKTLPPYAALKIAAIKRPKKLTRRYLQQQLDWTDWNNSEFKQLNQYYDQGTFGTPTTLPNGANLLPLLWTYIIKDNGTKKARCVCNGSPKMRVAVTLANTYAKSLEQTGARIFWASTAIHNFIVIGADASNAFAEAPPPKAPLYVTIDQPYREWYKHKFPDKPAIPQNAVLQVKGALQGHPESARLWAKLIDKIIQNLGLQPTTHEPCLYSTDDYNNTGKRVLFLRQVDDFAIACEDTQTAKDIIKAINDKMTIDVKELGMMSRFNGVDVQQSKHFVKLFNSTYIDKIMTCHEWIHQEPIANVPTPMHADPKYIRKLELAEPADPTTLKSLTS